MTLKAGTQLGPYEIVEPLGSGGMGEVYRARDTRLGRDVAVKVLPAELTARTDLRTRLEREAKAISALNHPNICTLHDIGVDGDLTFLVMELIDGEPLSRRLERGRLPLSETMRYATQIAEALSAAHRQGIIHRDLKPGNVMLTRSGAKLLDFGLAKTFVDGAGDSDSSRAPTLAAPLTEEGSFLGTPQYMAPEQIAAQDVDDRADIFAFGAVLYEMLTGVRAFSGGNRQELFHSILHDEPVPPRGINPEISLPLERVVLRCLAKEPDMRWQCMADLADELRWCASESVGDPQARKGVRRGVGLWVAGGVLAALLTGGLGVLTGSRLFPAGVDGSKRVESETTRLSLQLPPEAPFLPVDRSALAISPDGRQIVYTGGTLDKHALYMRSLDQATVRPLDGTEDGVSPFFSGDGNRIGFFTRYTLRYVASAGGPAQEVSDSPPVTRGAQWLADGDVLASPTKAAPLVRFRVSTEGPSELATKIDPAIGLGQSWPNAFDHDRKVLVTVIGPKSASYDEAKIVAINLESGEQKVVLEGGSQARYLPTGHLVFVREGTLYAAPFDVDSMQVTAAPKSVIEHILSDPSSGVAHLATSDEGTLVYARGDAMSGNQSNLEWMDSSGHTAEIPAGPRAVQTPRLSPDGNRIVLSVSSASDDLWTYDLLRKAYRRLTFGGRNMSPIWTPDGKTVTYSSVRGFPSIYNLAADGSGKETTVARDQAAALFPGSWSPDGTTLALSRFSPNGWDVYTLTTGGTPQPFAATRFDESAPSISPDGHWIAYCSDESGTREVYVTSFPEAGEKVQVSTGGGAQPVWMSTGLGLLYRSGDRLMAVKLETAPRLSASAPTELISGLPLSGDSSVPGAPFYDITSDGQQVLIVRKKPPPGVDHLEVVLNWFTELQRRVPIRSH